MKITTFGLDPAKNVFQLHWVEPRPVRSSGALPRSDDQVLRPAQRPVVAMEACGSAHYWARKLIELGHEARLIAPQFVRPFVRSNKTDAADAQAIWEAAQRPERRFVAVKSASTGGPDAAPGARATGEDAHDADQPAARSATSSGDLARRAAQRR